MTNSGHANAGNLKDIIFKQHANSPALTKALSLFPGLGYAAGYKVAQRVYKFGGQPYFNDILNTNYGSYFKSFFGEKNGKAIMSASAGSLTGIGEVVLLPLDVLKIKRQTNPESFKGRGIVKIVADEGFGLYRGWGWTMARNAPGSFAVRDHSLMWTFIYIHFSSLVVLLLLKATFSVLKTTARLLSTKTSLL